MLERNSRIHIKLFLCNNKKKIREVWIFFRVITMKVFIIYK